MATAQEARMESGKVDRQNIRAVIVLRLSSVIIQLVSRHCSVMQLATTDTEGTTMQTRYGNLPLTIKNGIATIEREPKFVMPIHDGPKKFDSKWEETFCSELVLRKHAGLIKGYWYHPFSMWLPGQVRYSPDFMIQYPDGLEKRVEIVEIKGWSRNLRDGMTRLKIAAAIFPCFTWKLVKKQKGGGWDEQEVG